MNIIDQAKGFVESLRELASRSVWDWRRCPHCGQSMTCKYGTYVRRPWFFEGRREASRGYSVTAATVVDVRMRRGQRC